MEHLRELFESRRTGDPVRRTVLSARQREVVELRLKEYSFAYIGRALGISEATARTHYRNAIENLALELRKRSGEIG
jgi:DNA-binding CsgD family transcriptional regulator